MLIIYADYIEPPLARRWQVTEVLARHVAQLSLLILIDSSLGGLYIVRGTRFHFDEAENVFFPSDEINFSATMWRAEVARDHGVSETAQVKVGVFFAASSGELMRRDVFGRERFARQPVEGSDDGVGDASGHAD